MKKVLEKSIWVFMFFLPVFAIAQHNNQPVINAVVSGKIIDAKTLLPLEGTYIQIKGTTNGSSSDKKGIFKLKTGQKLPFTIVVTYIGYKSQELLIDSSYVELKLQSNENTLDQVAVVGYGTQRRREVTGAVATISKDKLLQVTSSFDNLLQGTVSGVTVTQSSGQPGSTASVRIRGGNSLSFGNDPLYVIDGFIYYNDNSLTNFTPAAGTSVTGVSTNALSTINPSDIESIDVLKDASATAIYGSRGANGVVIITTKKGERNGSNISYSGTYGTQNITKSVPVLNGSQWANYFDELYKATPTIQAGLASNKKLIDSLGAAGTNGDWVGAAQRTGASQNHQLTIYGGDEKSKYSISGNYFDQTGVLTGTDFSRYSARINYEKNVFTNLKLTTNVFGSSSSEDKLYGSPYNSINFSNAYSSLYATNPLQIVKNADGTYNTSYIPAITPTYNISNGQYLADNPIQDLASTINQTKITRYLANFAAEYKVANGLVLKSTFGTDVQNTKLNYYSPSYITLGNNEGTISGSGSVAVINTLSWLNENTINYDHSFNNTHFLNVLAGFTTQYIKSENTFTAGQTFPSDATTYNDLWAASANKVAGSGEATQARNSFLGRFLYSYNHKYNITLTGRYDGASVLGTNKQWGFFPSAGFSWIVSQEDFFKKYNKEVDFLKLRLTAGSVGNSNIPAYSSLATLTSNSVYLGNPLTGISGLAPSQPANPNLTWETTTQYDAGVDVGLLKKRINLTADIYYKKTTNLLVQGSGLVPLSSGYTTVSENIGSLENKGLELALNTVNIKTNDFAWTSTLIYATNANKVLSLGPSQSFQPIAPTGQVSPVIVKVGLPVSTFWGYKTDGLLTTSDVYGPNAVPLLSGNQKTGDRKYLHANGVTGSVITTADKQNLGNAQAKFTASFSNTLNYKNFDLTFFFQGSFGNKIFNLLQQQLSKTTTTGNVTALAANAWDSVSNPKGKFPRITNAPVMQVEDTYIEDGSYIKLKTLTLGYNFPANIASRIFAKQIRVYVSAQNLFTITKYSGLDPEVNFYDQNPLQQGIDYGTFPNYRSYLFGVNLTF